MDEADLERRFGGLRRLHGERAYERLRGLRLAVIGVGGVGSWASEALARCGVSELTLVDLDHVAESNVNRQIHALSGTLGQAKVLALKDRIAQIHPACLVHPVEEFIDEANAAPLLSAQPLDGIVECCDQVRAKAAVLAWAQAHGVAAVCVGAAGGKTEPQQVQVEDLATVSHDPLLSSLRQRLRQRHQGARKGPMQVPCVFSREAVRPPQDQACDLSGDGSLNCHGFGSSVMVTATFGLVAASHLVNTLLVSRAKR